MLNAPHTSQTTTTTEQNIDLWSSSCNLVTITDLAAVLAPTNSAVLSACAVANALSTADTPTPQQQRLFEKCEHQRMHAVDRTTAYVPPWWHALQAAVGSATPAPPAPVQTTTRITCPQAHDSVVDTIQAAYDAHVTLQGGGSTLHWDVHGNASTALDHIVSLNTTKAAQVVLYDSAASMPSIQQLEGLLESQRALVVVRVAEANTAALSAQDWVRTMQSYGYGCLLRLGAGSMRATGCMSAAFDEAAQVGDVVCVVGTREDLFDHWS